MKKGFYKAYYNAGFLVGGFRGSNINIDDKFFYCEFSVSRTAWRNKSHSIFSIYKVKVAQEILCIRHSTSDQKHL